MDVSGKLLTSFLHSALLKTQEDIDDRDRENGVNRKKQGQGSGRKRGIAFGILLAIVILFAVYFGTYYRADATAQAALAGDETVKVSSIPEGGYFLDGPATDTALIFYPGAKVETAAYAPLLHGIAEKDCDVFLLDMPLHMAVFDIDKADEIRDACNYSSWYMAGHSLGAAMAAQYTADHLEEYEGLILLAGYPTKDLHRDGFGLLSIYGTNDMDPESLQKNAEYRPEDYTEVVIKGGNHAQFGNYGIQRGDGTAEISAEDQQEQTKEAVWSFLEKRQ